MSSCVGVGARDDDSKSRRLSDEGFDGGGYGPATGRMFDNPALRVWRV